MQVRSTRADGVLRASGLAASAGILILAFFVFFVFFVVHSCIFAFTALSSVFCVPQHHKA
jgi:hypothetical protein